MLHALLQEKSDHPFYLLTSGKNNSLGASMEILSYLRLHNIKGEIIHGQPSYVARRLQLLKKVEQARRQLKGCRLAVIGKPSDWLIASTANYDEVKEKLGIELIDISMDEMLSTVAATPKDHHSRPDDFFPGAEQIYEALKTLLEKYQLKIAGDYPEWLIEKLRTSIWDILRDMMLNITKAYTIYCFFQVSEH